MVGAMVVLVVLLVGWVALRSLISHEPSSPVHTVDYTQDVPAVRKVASFEVLAPPSLPDGWKATTVSFTDAPTQHWHLGVLTDRERYVGLEQGGQSVRSMLEEYVDKQASRGAAVDIAGRRWATWTDAGGDLALVRREGTTTTLVVGHEVSKATLVAYTASLR